MQISTCTGGSRKSVSYAAGAYPSKSFACLNTRRILFPFASLNVLIQTCTHKTCSDFFISQEMCKFPPISDTAGGVFAPNSPPWIRQQWRTYVQGIQGMPCPFGFGAPFWIRKGTLKTCRYVCIYGAPVDQDAPLSVMPWSFENSCVRHCPPVFFYFDANGARFCTVVEGAQLANCRITYHRLSYVENANLF